MTSLKLAAFVCACLALTPLIVLAMALLPLLDVQAVRQPTPAP